MAADPAGHDNSELLQLACDLALAAGRMARDGRAREGVAAGAVLEDRDERRGP